MVVKHIDFWNYYKYDPQFREQTSEMKKEREQQELAHEKCFLRRIKLRFRLEKEIMIEVLDL